MDAKNLNFQFFSKEELQNLLTPIISKLEIIDRKLIKSTPSETQGYFRNKDLRKKFGLSANSIIKYRELGLLPFTKIGDVYLYPIEKLEEVLNDNSNWDSF